MRKVNYLYYITLVFCILLSACIKTEDDVEDKSPIPDPNNPVVTLTNEYLAGYWELFYNNKSYKKTASESMGTDYRYPDIEGRKIYYGINGDYKELNAWGDILEEGKYRIKRKTNDREYDSIFYTFPRPTKPEEDTITHFAYPMITKEYFDRYNYYEATNAALKQQFFITDMWFFRKVNTTYKLPNYPKVNNISKASIIGSWQFKEYVYNTYGKNQNKPELDKLIGQTYTFKEDNTYTIRVKDDSADGQYFIIDDIIQQRRTVIDEKTGKPVWKTTFLWIKDPIYTNSTGTYFVQYERYKDINDLTNVIIIENTYKKIE